MRSGICAQEIGEIDAHYSNIISFLRTMIIRSDSSVSIMKNTQHKNLDVKGYDEK